MLYRHYMNIEDYYDLLEDHAPKGKHMTTYKFYFKCPSCGYVREPCDFPECREEALYEGWYGSGHVVKRRACEIHVTELRGYEDYKASLAEQESEEIS